MKELLTSLPEPPKPADGHRVQLYEDDAVLTATVAHFLGTGLIAGGTLVVIATPEHTAAFTECLNGRGFDVERAVRTGRLVLLDARQTLAGFMVGNLPDPARFRARVGAVLDRCSPAGGEKIFAYGEMVDLLWHDGNPRAALLLEEMWNVLARERGFELLCAYRVDQEQETASNLNLRRVFASHSHSHVGQSVVAEKHFRLLVDAVKDHAIFMLDPGGRIVSWNAGAERLKGWPADEIIGEHFSRFFPEEDIRARKPEWELENALKDGRFEDEGWRVKKDGTTFWANVVVTAVHDEEGRHIGFAKVTRDLSERKRLAERLLGEQIARARAEVARQEAEQAAHLAEMFAGILGHDLRNPLSSIVSGANLLLMIAGDERQRRSAARILSSSERMARMIDQLLDFTRIRLGGGLHLELCHVNLGELARELAEETEAGYGCAVRVERQGNTSGQWSGDRVAQLLSNLLGNAAQHGNGARVVKVRVDGRAADQVVLEIANDGCIPPEVLPGIFEPFRGNRYQRGMSRGLGLGLYISREIVRSHGGSIEVSSSPEQGTTFTIKLPRRTLTRT